MLSSYGLLKNILAPILVFFVITARNDTVNVFAYISLDERTNLSFRDKYINILMETTIFSAQKFALALY